jgi:hypothetical protein
MPVEPSSGRQQGEPDGGKPPIVVELPAGTPEPARDFDTEGSEEARRDLYCGGLLMDSLGSDVSAQRQRELSLAYAKVSKAGEVSLTSEGFSKSEVFGIVRHWEQRGRLRRAPAGFSPSDDDCIARAKLP